MNVARLEAFMPNFMNTWIIIMIALYAVWYHPILAFSSLVISTMMSLTTLFFNRNPELAETISKELAERTKKLFGDR